MLAKFWAEILGCELIRGEVINLTGPLAREM